MASARNGCASGAHHGLSRRLLFQHELPHRLLDTASTTGATSFFVINPNTDFTPGESCTGTVFASRIVDFDGNDPPDNMASSFTWSFTVAP